MLDFLISVILLFLISAVALFAFVLWIFNSGLGVMDFGLWFSYCELGIFSIRV